MLAVENKKVIGQLGFIPVRLKYKEKISNAQWACDLLVDPDYRKHGIASRLFEEGMKRDVVSLGNNASPKADKLMLKLGFKPVPSGRLMVFPLDTKHLLQWVIPSKIGFAIPLLSKIIQPYFSVKKNSLKKKITDFKLCKWEETLDLIESHENQISLPHILHDADFMNWRATGLENFTERVGAAKNDQGNYCLHSSFHPYYNVYEWYCKDIDNLKSMLALLIQLALKSKATTLQLVANTNEEEKQLSSLGFIRSRSIERIIHYSKKNILDGAGGFYFTLYDTDLNL